MKKIFLFIIALLIVLVSNSIYAYDITKDTKIYVSGETIGIKLETGVMVMGTYGINTEEDIITPWKSANIKDGDIIVNYDNSKITNTESLFNAIYDSKGKQSSIVLKRDSNLIASTITPVSVNDKFSLGLYIKDHIMGVGTLTYIIPGINLYGALGHSMVDSEAYGGEIYQASVDRIIKPQTNKAGEKRAIITSDSFGNISKNSITGIHGYIDNKYNKDNLQLLNIKTRDEVKKGSAQILTCVNDNDIVFYDIEITDVKKQTNKDIKGIKFKVTDKELISASGGIVQGMSGSPIIQDNMIIGSVTHVTIKNPLLGYGIFIEFMLEEMDVHIVQ